MGELINTGTEGGLISIIHGGGNVSLPQAFARDIYLFSSHIAGTSHVEGIDELAAQLQPDMKLNFFREADNAYDHNAIVIRTPHGVKLGYVPKTDNVIFARLMDAGKLLFGKMTGKEDKHGWWLIKIDIYLHE